MGLITSPGLGSGLDVNAIISAIVNADRAPLEFRLNQRESIAQTTLSGLGGLKSALSSLKTAAEKLDASTDFNLKKLSIAESGFYTATSTSSAAISTYAIEVQKLAKGSRLESNVIVGGASKTYANDTLTFTASGTTFNVAILATDTLVDIRNKINNASGNNFVSASIITTNAGTKLVYDSSKTGTGNGLVVTSGTAALDEIALNMNSTQAAQDAVIMLDGAAVNSSTNTFATAISDVTITVQKQHTLGVTTNLSISADTSGTKKAIEDFVKVFNSTLKELKALTANTETESGALASDSATRSVLSSLRNMVSESVSSVSGTYKTLASIGVTSTRTGELELKGSVLDKALSEDINKVVQLFSNSDGVANKIRTFASSQIDSDGIIKSREAGVKNELDRIVRERETLKVRTEKLETRLRNQYAALDSLVAQMSSTSTFISQNLNRIPNYNSSKSK